MPALPFVKTLLGWNGEIPNIADRGSRVSRSISEALFEECGITDQVSHVAQTAGAALEEAVLGHLTQNLPASFQEATVTVSRNRLVSDFDQYKHLATLRALIESDSSKTLRAAIGTDYQIRPDVTVGLGLPDGGLLLHAAVPCKWTLRSDRAQNIRHEAVVLIRHRRGRLPHIVPVTAEPLPKRLASLARGTAEVDVVFHIALDELKSACAMVGNAEQSEVLAELLEHDRLRDLSELLEVLRY
jgi:hypothetical protein